MSARKKSSKGSAKKNEDSASRSKTLSLLALLKQNTASYLEGPQGDNLTAEILEALLQKQSGKLEKLLEAWSHDQKAVRHVAENLVESKITLFTYKITQILQNNHQQLYLYPWLQTIYATHRTKVPEQLTHRLAKACSVKIGETEELMKLGGKLSLIVQQ